jgi:glycosyltransferase involved in cell wall biosynthesis
MRIAHLGKYYAPQRGGIERAVETLCRGLARLGHDVTAVVANSSDQSADERIDGVRVIRVPRRFVIRSQPLTAGLAKVVAGVDFDVLHVHTPNPLGSLAALRALGDRPLVVSHHSDIVQQRRVLGLLGAFAHRALYEKASVIVAATPLNVRYSRILPRFASRCRVIPFPVPQAPAPASVPRSLPASWPGTPFGLFVGRLVYYKGLHVLLDALESSPDLRVAIVGEGPLDRELRERASQSALGERVAFLGTVADDELQALYRACRFLVLPSIEPSEAFGLVQLEAMAAGRPVISTNLRSGVPFVNQHARTGLIVPVADSAALAGAMQKLSADAELCTRLGRAGQARAERDFSEDRILGEWIKLYSELCRGP